MISLAFCLFSSLLIFLSPFIGFAADGEAAVADSYAAEIKNWQQEREKSLTSPSGWLKDGKNSFGSDPANDIVFPAGKCPELMGSFFLEKGEVTIQVNAGIRVLHGEKIVTAQVLKNDQSGEPTVLSYGSLIWFVIERSSRYGVRLRDYESPDLLAFKGLERYQVDPAWRIEARFEEYEIPKTLSIPTVLGTQIDMLSKGTLVFRVDKQTYRLEASMVGDPADEMLYVIFGDATNGEETYGGGRYLYVKEDTCM